MDGETPEAFQENSANPIFGFLAGPRGGSGTQGNHPWLGQGLDGLYPALTDPGVIGAQRRCRRLQDAEEVRPALQKLEELPGASGRPDQLSVQEGEDGAQWMGRFPVTLEEVQNPWGGGLVHGISRRSA